MVTKTIHHERRTNQTVKHCVHVRQCIRCVARLCVLVCQHHRSQSKLLGSEDARVSALNELTPASGTTSAIRLVRLRGSIFRICWYPG